MLVELRCRNGWYFVVVPKQRGLGRAVVRHLGTRDHAEAKQLLKLCDAEKMALAAKADAIGRDIWTRLLAGRKVSCSESAQAHDQHRFHLGHSERTIHNSAMVIDAFLRQTGLAKSSIAEVTVEHISGFINADDGTHASTRRWKLDRLSAWLGFCVERHWLVTNPAKEISVRVDRLTQDQLVSTPIAPFTDGEVKTLIANVPVATFWHGAILLGYTYGLRISTILQLEESNVVGHQLRVYTKKGKRVVCERLTDELIAWLDVWRKVRPASDMPYLFPAQAAWGPSTAKDQFREILRRLGIEGRSFHSLRKTTSNRVWKEALQDLGSEQAKKLAALVARHGYRRVQAMLGHAPGSDVTADHYLQRD